MINRLVSLSVRLLGIRRKKNKLQFMTWNFFLIKLIEKVVEKFYQQKSSKKVRKVLVRNGSLIESVNNQPWKN